MDYILLLYSDESGWDQLTEADQIHWMTKYDTFVQTLRVAGVLRGGAHLLSSSLTATVRTETPGRGELRVTDGPFAESKEQLAGYFVLHVPDRETAIAWAQQCPGAQHGAVEVRPLGMLRPISSRILAENGI